MALIAQRTEELKKENNMKRRKLMGAGCAAACFLLVVGLGSKMPDIMEQIYSGDLSYGYAAAGLITADSKSGYIIMGLLSFILGVCVTMTVHRIFRGKNGRYGDEPESAESKNEDDHNEF